MKQKCYLAIYEEHWRDDLLSKPITKEVLASLQEKGYNDYIDDVPGPVPCTIGKIFPAGCFDDEDSPGSPAIHIEFEKEESELIYGDTDRKDPGDCAVRQILPEEIIRIGRGHFIEPTANGSDYYINW